MCLLEKLVYESPDGDRVHVNSVPVQYMPTSLHNPLTNSGADVLAVLNNLFTLQISELAAIPIHSQLNALHNPVK